MRTTISQVASFNRPVQLLLVNQLTINIGFYMLMPYLAGYLSAELAMAAWMVGLVLGMRNLSQQGMFLLGGSLADRIGYKPMILAGLGLRVVGFAMLGLVDSLPGLIVASALTGLAGALFNPAVRAYLAAEAGERKVEAFALFNVFYQTGILVGPLIGLALLGVAFRWVCLVAAVLFLLLLIMQSRALPARRGGAAGRPAQSMLADWRQVIGHRSFLLFSVAMIGSYVLNFQVYLGLPIEVRRVTGGETGVAILFAVSGLLTVLGQVRLTGWVTARWTPAQAITRGLLLMAAAFIPLALATAVAPATGAPRQWWTHALAVAPVLASGALLTLATMIVYPFEMATIVNLSGEHTVGTYYGFYNTLAGIGIAAGNLLTGLALDTGREQGMPWLPWVALIATGLICAAAIAALDRKGHLSHRDRPTQAARRPADAVAG
jgi:MFS family permease